MALVPRGVGARVGRGDGGEGEAAPTAGARGAARPGGGGPTGPGSGRRRGPWKRLGWGSGDACVGHRDPRPAPTRRPGPRAVGRGVGGLVFGRRAGPGPGPGAPSTARGARPSRGGTDRRGEEEKLHPAGRPLPEASGATAAGALRAPSPFRPLPNNGFGAGVASLRGGGSVWDWGPGWGEG